MAANQNKELIHYKALVQTLKIVVMAYGVKYETIDIKILESLLSQEFDWKDDEDNDQ